MATELTTAATVVATVEALTPPENSTLTTADQTSSSNDHIPKILKDEAKTNEEETTKATEADTTTKPTEADTTTKPTETVTTTKGEFVEETKEEGTTKKIILEIKEAETATKEIKEPAPVTTDTNTAESTKPSEPEPEPELKQTTEATTKATTTTTGEEQNPPAKDTVNIINADNNKELPVTPVGEEKTDEENKAEENKAEENKAEVKDTKVDGDGESSDRGTSNGKKNNRKSYIVSKLKSYFTKKSS